VLKLLRNRKYRFEVIVKSLIMSQIADDLPLFPLLEEAPSTPLLLLTADDIYDSADLLIIQKIKEDRTIERKPAGIGIQAVGDYLCMWANTSPDGGLLVVGIEDDGTLSGCVTKEIQHLNELESAGMQHCADASYAYKRVPFRHPNGDQDFVILFRVKYHPTKVVRNNRSEVFARFGDKKRKLTEAQIRELEIDKGQVPFEQEPSILEYPRDFNSELIHEFAEAFRKTRELSYPLTDTDVLELRHLGQTKDGKFLPNNACAIVFASDPYKSFPGCRIRFFRFEGEEEHSGERWNPQKDIYIEGFSMPIQIRKMEEVLDSQLRTFTRLGSDNKFHTAPEYPKFAWFEALVNACVHRSYALKNMNIFVKMFDDRIEIESPGGFPPFVTPENIYTTHHPRNPILFDAMQLLGYVRGAREGTRRMRDLMIQNELPLPEFVQKSGSSHSVMVRLKNDYKQRKAWLDSDAVAVVGETLFSQLTQDEKRAINFVSERGSISVSDLQRLTQGTWPSAKKTLEILKQRGILYDKRRTPRNPLGRDTRARYFLVGR